MLIIPKKAGAGINGEGIFDFGRILLKKALNSNFVKSASKAINSELGQTAIKAVKRAAESELGQVLQKKALTEISNKIPDSVKAAAQSELGQVLTKTVIPVNAQATFQKLGIVRPPKRKAPKRKKGKRGRGFIYPQQLISQFGSGIVLE